ncbi:hypothetical protein FocTR4_00002041 [Fusarium oxysporum f. sp. cubense]|nr:hypothetical protein FocTR4_00002041 [Fusarium oxysporum f. sp. cubense]
MAEKTSSLIATRSTVTTGTHFPNPPVGGPSLNQADTDPSDIYPHTPQRQATLTQTQTSPSSPVTEAIVDDMAPPRRDASGRFTPGESAFAYHTGNVKVKC